MMLVWFGLIYTHLPEKIKSGIDPCSQWGGMDAKPRSHPLRPTRAYSLAQKTVYFIGEITVKIDSRGIYSLENINYHDAYLNISVIATCQPSFVDRSGAPNVANHLHMFGRPSGALPFTTRALRRIRPGCA